MDDFRYSEALVAGQIGLPRETARDLREAHLKRGLDWKKKNGEILLTEPAVERLVSLCLTKMPDLSQCMLPAQPELNVEHPNRRTMKIVPPMPINPRIVYAMDEDGNQELVWVGRNATFVYDDEIQVEPHPEQQGILMCVSEIPRDRRRPWRR